jgi:hypothetical protein
MIRPCETTWLDLSGQAEAIPQEAPRTARSGFHLHHSTTTKDTPGHKRYPNTVRR